MLKILLVDDHQLLLDGLQYVFKDLDKHLDLITTDSAQEAFALVKQHLDMDLMVLDLNLDEFDGIDLLNKLKRNNLVVPTVILSASDNLYQIRQALDLGAMGFIPKSYPASKLISALRMVLAGHIYIPEESKSKLLSASPISDSFNLSQRQLEVIKHMAKGKSNKQIADTLFIAETTIKSHITAIFRALEVSSRHECIQKVKKIGLV